MKIITDKTNQVAVSDDKALYALAAIKQAGGEETPRFEAKITKAGKVVGTVYNEGMGGCCGYHFKPDSEEKIFRAWIDKNFPGDFEPDDTWVYAQMDAVAEAKRLQRMSAKKAIFRIEGDNPDEGVRTLKIPLKDPRAAAYFSGVSQKEYKGKKIEVYDPDIKGWIVWVAPADMAKIEQAAKAAHEVDYYAKMSKRGMVYRPKEGGNGKVFIFKGGVYGPAALDAVAKKGGYNSPMEAYDPVKQAWVAIERQKEIA